jgi:hypothetical protein
MMGTLHVLGYKKFKQKLGMKMTVFCDAEPCNLVETDQHFKGAYCLSHHGTLTMDAVSNSEMVNFYQTT